MGCTLCNITSCEEFAQGSEPAIKNPFFCPTEQGRDEFLEQLAYDIAYNHPEIVGKINDYVKKRGEEGAEPTGYGCHICGIIEEAPCSHYQEGLDDEDEDEYEDDEE